MRTFLWTLFFLLALTRHAVDAQVHVPAQAFDDMSVRLYQVEDGQTCRRKLVQMYNPSVLPADDFDAEADARALNDAMDEMGTNEAAIISILAHRANAQRQEIKDFYGQTYDEDLIEKLQSELSGDFEEVILAVMQTPAVYDARSLRKAMRGPGTKDSILIDIMFTRTNDELVAIKQAYNEEFERDLVDDLMDETSGDFKHLLVAVCQANRDELYEVDEDEAQTDAQEIYDAGEGRWFGTDEDAFTKILAQRSMLQLGLIFDKYADIAGNSFEEAIMGETSGNLQDAYLTIVSRAKDTLGLFAEHLHASMRGIGTDEDALIRTIVTRSEIDMEDIKDKYEDMYGNSLIQDIDDECSSDYKRLLLALLRNGE